MIVKEHLAFVLHLFEEVQIRLIHLLTWLIEESFSIILQVMKS